MLIGKPPFETTNIKMTYTRIQSTMYIFPPDKPIPLSAKLLIQNILNKNPAKRPSLEDILNSEFFKDNGSIMTEDEEAKKKLRASASNPDYKLKSKAQLNQKVDKRQNDNEKVEEKEESAQEKSRRTNKNVFYKRIFASEMANKTVTPTTTTTKEKETPTKRGNDNSGRLSTINKIPSKLTQSTAYVENVPSDRKKIIDRNPIDNVKKRKISALDIIKNSTIEWKLVDSTIKNSIIEDQQEAKELPGGNNYKKAETYTSERYNSKKEKEEQEKEKVRDSSVSSQVSNHKKYFFQRLIKENETREEEDAANSSIQKNVQATDAANKTVSNNNFAKRTQSQNIDLVSGPVTTKPSPLPNKLSNLIDSGKAKIKLNLSNSLIKNNHERRTSSAQPTFRMKPFWKNNEEEHDEEENFDPKDYVKKWIDHTSKYGLVFIMNSGVLGILFNDHTKMIFKLHYEKFVYLAKNTNRRNREEVKIYALQSPPKELEKKVSIMSDIKKNLMTHESELNLKDSSDINLERIKDIIYVRNWVIAKQVTVFKLSNTTYQAIFQDKSEIIMSSQNKALVFVGKDRKKTKYTINSSEIQKNRSLNVRIEYFKKVLRKWIERDSNNAGHNVSKINHKLDV